jgi:hypothetical protein
MLPVVVTPDAELAVLDYLRPQFSGGYGVGEYGIGAFGGPTGVKLGTVVPSTRPFVQVRRIGGSSELPGYDQPRVDVIVYHDTDHNRMGLAMLCWALLKAAAADRAGDAVVSYVETTLGPRQMPDPANATARVAMFTCDLLVRSA